MSIQSIASVSGADNPQPINSGQSIEKTNNEQAINTEFQLSVALMMARQYLKMAIRDMDYVLDLPESWLHDEKIQFLHFSEKVLNKSFSWSDLSKKAMKIAFTALPKCQLEGVKEGILEVRRLLILTHERRSDLERRQKSVIDQIHIYEPSDHSY